MEWSKQQILSTLPHQPPLRFVDRIFRYEPGTLLHAGFCYDAIDFADRRLQVPPALLLEGLAQTAVMMIQLETQPLKENDIPLLGSVDMTVHQEVQRNERVQFLVRPVRIQTRQAVMSGKIIARNGTALTATISVAVTSGSNDRSKVEEQKE